MSVRRMVSAMLAVGLVCCATALATSSHYNGPAAGGVNNAGVEFNLQRSLGKAPVVRGFEFHNVPAACKGYGTTAVTEPLTIKMKLNANRRFSGSQSLNGGHVHVVIHGAFASNFKKATGTLRAQGSVPGCGSADTGIVHWTAPRK